MSLRPAPAGTGVVFRRRHEGTTTDIPARFGSVVGASQSTQLGVGASRISTVEHLLAALRAKGLDNVIVETDGEELPILDGSASGWITMLERAGHAVLESPRKSLAVRKKVEVTWGERRISISPADSFSFCCEIDFDHP